MAVRAMDGGDSPLRGPFRVATLWYWGELASATLLRSLSVALAFALVALLLAGWQAPAMVASWFWVAAAVTPLAGLLAALILHPSVPQAIRVLDHRLELRQQLGTAEELISRSDAGPLAAAQIARAETVAREVRIGSAFRLFHGREAATALSLAMAVGLVQLLSLLGIVIPNPLAIGHLAGLGPQQVAAAGQPLGQWRQADAARPRTAAMEPVREMLDRLRRDSQRGSLSSGAAAGSLARANAELNRVAAASRAQQEALEGLANELRGTAAAREVAESMRQGDFEKGAEQLREVGRNSDQFSQAAKQELSQALNRASSLAQSSPNLARAAGQASQTLQQRDYQANVKSMEELARSVEEAAGRMVPQSELAESWQQLEELSKQLGEPESQLGQSPGSLTPPQAQGPREAGDSRAQGQQPSEATGSMGADAGMPLSNILGDMAGQSRNGAGSGQGDPPLGDESPPTGSNSTNSVEVEGRLGSLPPETSSPSDRAPTVLREGKGSSDGSGAREEPGGPASVPAENVYIPGERRATVRDYFSEGANAQ